MAEKKYRMEAVDGKNGVYRVRGEALSKPGDTVGSLREVYRDLQRSLASSRERRKRRKASSTS
jgi:hypothetical protein